MEVEGERASADGLVSAALHGQQSRYNVNLAVRRAHEEVEAHEQLEKGGSVKGEPRLLPQVLPQEVQLQLPAIHQPPRRRDVALDHALALEDVRRGLREPVGVQDDVLPKLGLIEKDYAAGVVQENQEALQFRLVQDAESPGEPGHLDVGQHVHGLDRTRSRLLLLVPLPRPEALRAFSRQAHELSLKLEPVDGQSLRQEASRANLGSRLIELGTQRVNAMACLPSIVHRKETELLCRIHNELLVQGGVSLQETLDLSLHLSKHSNFAITKHVAMCADEQHARLGRVADDGAEPVGQGLVRRPVLAAAARNLLEPQAEVEHHEVKALVAHEEVMENMILLLPCEVKGLQRDRVIVVVLHVLDDQVHRHLEARQRLRCRVAVRRRVGAASGGAVHGAGAPRPDHGLPALGTAAPRHGGSALRLGAPSAAHGR
mmetsp:Transcript_136262/g.435957  ORF Transcript_136262/g.435957 Transcript_136262/m.435957 type:complete len:431 (+) Transcript_136262:3932-5224(+)